MLHFVLHKSLKFIQRFFVLGLFIEHDYIYGIPDSYLSWNLETNGNKRHMDRITVARRIQKVFGKLKSRDRPDV